VRALIAALLSAAVGCDDPAVAARAAEVLEHGATRAHAECFVSDPATPPAFSYEYFSLSASLMQDGSCIAAFSGSVVSPFPAGRQSLAGFSPRGAAQPCRLDSVVSPNQTLFVSAGEIASDATSVTYSIETYCTGFNLEAFGELP
jgi:hypothetical protein